MNAWSYTSTPAHAFTTWCLVNQRDKLNLSTDETERDLETISCQDVTPCSVVYIYWRLTETLVGIPLYQTIQSHIPEDRNLCSYLLESFRSQSSLAKSRDARVVRECMETEPEWARSRIKKEVEGKKIRTEEKQRK
jgi:hypothetical protein